MAAKIPGIAKANIRKSVTRCCWRKKRKRPSPRPGFKVIMTRTGDTYPELERASAMGAQTGRRSVPEPPFQFRGQPRSAVRAGRGDVLHDARASEFHKYTRRGRERVPRRGTGSIPGTCCSLTRCSAQWCATSARRTAGSGARASPSCATRKCPPVLVEAGFMTHPGESQKIYSSAYRKQLAQAITSGILAYQKAVERPAP